MRILMFMAKRFAFNPYQKVLQDADDADPDEHTEVRDAAVIFVHAEEGDEDDPKLETRFVKNVKWLANKRGFRNIVLHSFAHLSESDAPPEFADRFLQGAAERLRRTGYDVTMTPFGWVCEWEMSIYGEPLAKVFKVL